MNQAASTAGVGAPHLRADLAAIAAMIPPGTRVLDIGCGDEIGRAHV